MESYQRLDFSFVDDYEEMVIENEHEKYLNAKARKIVELIEKEYQNRVANESNKNFELRTKVAIAKPGTKEGFCQAFLPEEYTPVGYSHLPAERQKEIVFDFAKEVTKIIGSNQRVSKYEMIIKEIKFKGPWAAKEEGLKKTSCFCGIGDLCSRMIKYCKKQKRDFDHCQMIVACKPRSKKTSLIN